MLESTCDACPVHTHSPAGSASIMGCICNQGYTGADGAECAACGAGSFKGADGSAACTLCTSGKYSSDRGVSSCSFCPLASFSGPGSTVVVNCTCNKGYTGPNGASCTECIAGTYKDANGTAPCIECSPGKFSTGTGEASETTCADCPANAYSGPGSAVCTCIKGYTGPDGGVCTACISGTYKDVNGSSPCTLCGDHHYKNSSGNGPCLVCPPKAHTGGLVGQRECVCYPQFYSSDSQPIVCHSCPVGAICLEDTSCALRNPVRVTDDIFQFLCPGGRQITGNWTRVASTGAYELVSCPEGYQLLSSLETGSVEKQECAPGTWTKTSCPYGHEVYTTMTGREPFKKCNECDRHKECVNPPCGASSCTDCAPGYYKMTVGTHACQKCPADAHLGGIQVEGCGCGPGFYSSDEGCLACSPNYYCPGSGERIKCPDGSNSSIGSSLLTGCTCGAGHYLNIPAATSWKQTTDNVYMDFFNVSLDGEPGSETCRSQCVDVKCIQCGPGRFSTADATSCTSCPPGSTTTTPTSTSLEQCMCAEGFYLHGSECNSCPDHMSSPIGSLDITNCTCNPGHAGQNGVSCQACGLGEYKSSSGSVACDLCEEGKYLDQSAGTACLTCPAQTSSLQGQAHVQSCSCIPGYTGPGGLVGCQQCDRGKYKHTKGSSQCISCSAGTYSDQMGNNQSSYCSSCPPHMSSVQGSMSIVQCRCNVGYAGLDGDECFPCVIGKYKAIQGSLNCILCPLGKYTDSNASTICISCPPGKYSSQPGSTSDACTACPAGKHSDIEGATTEDNCAPCVAGTSSAVVGANSSTTCRRCPRGTYSPNGAMSTCSKCPSGKFGDVEGAGSLGIMLLPITLILLAMLR